jgi:hypothetical protein
MPSIHSTTDTTSAYNGGRAELSLKLGDTGQFRKQFRSKWIRKLYPGIHCEHWGRNRGIRLPRLSYWWLAMWLIGRWRLGKQPQTAIDQAVPAENTYLRKLIADPVFCTLFFQQY